MGEKYKCHQVYINTQDMTETIFKTVTAYKIWSQAAKKLQAACPITSFFWSFNDNNMDGLMLNNLKLSTPIQRRNN